MADYISREALLKKAITEKRFVFSMKDALRNEYVVETCYKDLADVINSIPAADVEPVRHGRWNTVKRDKITWVCSCCGKRVGAYLAGTSNYCPDCGAKMDGGMKNERD